MLMGEGMEKTLITRSRNVGDGFFTFNSSTPSEFGDGFMGCDLTVVNTAGPTKQQAVALHAQSNFAAFRMVNISAYQDTLYTHSFHQFYRDCHIYDTIDFIFDNTAVIFRNCQIFPRKPMPKQQNMITTHGRFEPTQDMSNSTLLLS
ncbi:hypothetical protein AMTRI_Chr07g27010 [Amborella trichopoda]